MFEQLRKLAMIGIGGTALAMDKISEYVDELVKQGKLTVEEGKKLTEELIQSKKEDVSEKDRAEIEAVLLEMNIAQKIGRASCRERVEITEGKVTVKRKQRNTKGEGRL